MSTLRKPYDLTLAIIGTTATEQWRQNRQLAECYLEPTRKLLQNFAAQKPTKIICFHDEKHRTQPGVYGAHEPSRLLFMILPTHQILLLGMVYSREDALDDWEDNLEKLEPDLREARTKVGPFALRLEGGYWTIPMDAEKVTTQVCEDATKKFFAIVCPPLRELPIQWLPEEEAYKLSKAIWDQLGTVGPLKNLSLLDQILWDISEP